MYNPSGSDPSVDPDVAKTLAYNFEQKIKRIEAQARTSKMRFLFMDESELLYDPAASPSLKPSGTKYSISTRFAGSVKEIKNVAGVLEFVFRDESKLSYSTESPSRFSR